VGSIQSELNDFL